MEILANTNWSGEGRLFLETLLIPHARGFEERGLVCQYRGHSSLHSPTCICSRPPISSVHNSGVVESVASVRKRLAWDSVIVSCEYWLAMAKAKMPQDVVVCLTLRCLCLGRP